MERRPSEIAHATAFWRPFLEIDMGIAPHLGRKKSKLSPKEPGSLELYRQKHHIVAVCQKLANQFAQIVGMTDGIRQYEFLAEHFLIGDVSEPRDVEIVHIRLKRRVRQRLATEAPDVIQSFANIELAAHCYATGA
jgi:hypothetical protein